MTNKNDEKVVEPALQNEDLLWKQYCLHVDLYKFYLELSVKLNVFYYAITGGILSFYFSHPQDRLAKYALGLPVVMSLALGILFLVGASLIQVSRQEVFNIRDRLGLETAPDIGVLSMFLRPFGFIFIGVAFAMTWVLLR